MPYANVANFHNDELHFALVCSPLTFHYDDQILDSGYSRYMCPNKEWHLNFEKQNGGVVFMGNDNSRKTFEIGSVCLKNHDKSISLDKYPVLRSLKKNLIFLGALQSEGIIEIMQDEILEVTSGMAAWQRTFAGYGIDSMVSS